MSNISDIINNPSSGSAITDAIQQYVDTPISTIGAATHLFKKSINIGEAIVSVLSNTGIAGFKFNVPQYEQIKLQSEATDNYIDTNIAVQDHITRKPVQITLKGLQGDYFYSIHQLEDMLAKVVPTLALIKQFLPKLSVSSNQALSQKYTRVSEQKTYDTNTYINNNPTIFNKIDLFKLYQTLCLIKSAQTRAFMYFEALWKSEALFTVETTWKRYDNMIITDVQGIRDNNADITEFSATFKQFDFTQSLYRSLDNAVGRTRQQLAEVAQKGIDKGQKVDI